MSWFDSLPPAEAAVPCGKGTHTVRWQAGQLTLPAHPDAEAELVLGALGADKPECVTLAQTWARHADDLAVLTAGPRGAADRVGIGWDEVAELRSQLPACGPQQALWKVPRALHYPSAGPIRGPSPGPQHPQPPGARPRRIAYGTGRPLPGHGIEDTLNRQLLQIELLELLALGAEFQFRLAGTVTAAWAVPDRAEARAGRRPEFSGVLTGRFALAARDWAGIDPDAVTVTPHEGQGWGSLVVSGTGRGRRLRASLPLGWLAEVWACGLAVVGGRLVVAVERPGYPRARVLALATPDSAPAPLEARATGSSAGGLMAWTA
jgi:hypothetical protein